MGFKLQIVEDDGTVHAVAPLVAFDGRMVKKSIGGEEFEKLLCFKSGALGYNASGRVMVEGREYQLSHSIVQLNTKDKTRAEHKAITRKIEDEIRKRHSVVSDAE